MKKILTSAITVYQKIFSFETGFVPKILGRKKPICIYYPTCSVYAKEAIERYGALKGTHLALKRVLRCTPFHSPGVDLVPPKK